MNKILYFALIAMSVYIYETITKQANSNYQICCCNQKTTMINTVSGETWILEEQNLGHPLLGTLNRSLDFCSPKGVCHYWVPISVLGCYKETMGISQNPEEMKNADNDALKLWKNQLKLN